MMTVEEWDQLVDTLYEQCLYTSKLLGVTSKNDVDAYLSFYGVHDSLYVCKRGDCFVGIGTVHPGVSDFTGKWRRPNGIWTIHLTWSEKPSVVADLFGQLFQRNKNIHQLWAWRQDHAVLLSPKKIERLISYGWKK